MIEPYVHILTTGPMEELSRRVHRSDAWCFICRKRRVFEIVVKTPVDPMSHYGPHSQIECMVCKSMDGDCFPGTSREGECE